MQVYKKRLESQGFRVHSIEFENDLFQTLIKNKIEEIWFSDLVDRLLESRLRREANRERVIGRGSGLLCCDLRDSLGLRTFNFPAVSLRSGL
jgi:predicted CopG family antitoxin